MASFVVQGLAPVTSVDVTDETLAGNENPVVLQAEAGLGVGEQQHRCNTSFEPWGTMLFTTDMNGP